MVRKKTIKAWQVVRYIEPHHGQKFCAACHGHLEEVCLMLTCLRGSWHQNWHRINSLISLSNYSVNSINHFHVWIIFPIKTQKKQVWKNCKQHDTVFKHKGTNLLFSQWQKTDSKNWIAFMASISDFATHIFMRWEVLTISNI